jgi:diacylglycerol O-acyltransferase
MSAADAAWLHMDRPTNLMVVNSVLWFDQPLDWERLREAFAERVVDRFPRYRQRVVEPTLGRPHWEDDPEFDLDLHLHRLALPAPGDQGALEELVGDRIVVPLDRSKPLWEMHLIDGYGPGSAVLLRTHHCIADGITSARVLLEMADEPPESAFTDTEDARPHGGPLGPLAGPVADAVSAARKAGETLLHEGMETAAHPGRVAEGARELARDLEGLAKVLAVSPEASSPLKGELGAARRVAWSRPIPLDLVKSVGHAAGATVNDTLVTAMTGALGAFVRERATPPEEIHATVPFNLRPLDQPLPRELGNRFGLIELGLPIGIEDPRERLLEVKRRMDAVKGSREGVMSYGVLGAIGRTPSQVEARIVDLFSGASTLVLTNVPGPRERVYMAGAPIAGVLPWAPASGSIGMTVTIFSYCDEVTVGLMADSHLVPDPHEIADLFETQLRELASAVGVAG